MSNQNARCANCRHRFIESTNDGLGNIHDTLRCRRYPPQMFVLPSDKITSAWPKVLSWQVCGEYHMEGVE